MHLKTLVLRGFKSFAASTVLKFEPGINCVVGPNGSGKSNVVDALAWVMGEQGAKNLRGGQMADVIFAGTAKRPALGRAEVSLTIDNTDGVLPIEYSEVTVTRTLFRSGGSEYAINGTACRLLDIQELLSDTGMGREMHVIVGQGKLDGVLTASAQERRGFIEEAAGVIKHRQRKDKALRKLESMQSNLTRIEDLAAELRRQLGPLARQAQTARRAETIQRTVFDARARLLADDLARAQARLAGQESDGQDLRARQEELDTQIARARASVEELQAEADHAGPNLFLLTESRQRLVSLTERFRALGELAGERGRSLSVPGPNGQRGESPAQIRERAARAREREEELTREVDAARDVLQAAVARRERAEEDERGIQTRLSSLNRALSDKKETEAAIAGRTEAVKSRIEALSEELERVKNAAQAAQERKKEAAGRAARLEQEIVAHTDGDDTLSSAHEQAARELQDAKDAAEKLRRDFSAAQTAAVQWETKAETLKMSLEPQDASAWVLAEYKQGIKGLVRDAIKIMPGWEAGIEAALPAAACAIVGGSAEDAVDVLRAARSGGAGRVEILVGKPKNPAEGQPEESAGRRAGAAVLKHSGFGKTQAILAAEAVQGEGGAARTVRMILDGTILAADLAVAEALLKQGAQRVATPAGDVLTPYHVRGGQTDYTAVLARAALCAEAFGHTEDAQRQAQRLRGELSAAAERLSRAEEKSAALAARLNARDAQLGAAGAQLGVLRQSLRAVEEELARSAARGQKIRDDLESLRAQRDELLREKELSEDTCADIPNRIAELEHSRAEAHKTAVDARGAETQARLALRTREERLRAQAGKADALERTAQSVQERIAAEQRAAQRRAQASLTAQRIGKDADRALARAKEILLQTELRQKEAEEQRARREKELACARRLVDGLLQQIRELEEKAHARELVLARLREQCGQLASKAAEDTGMDAGVLIEEFGPHLPVPTPEGGETPFVREQQEKRLEQATRALARLGKINPLALEEHAALEERLKYLTGQLQDLHASRADLQKIVKDVDARVEEIMRTALADVAREFKDIFSRLFPGGKGQLVFTEPQSALTTGVEIEARPPGKRVRRLSLLSGGERSLTAIAFLVAIFKARPSPFYVMDEVEAALDDVNLSRLLDIFRELQNRSQLLVITHQKRTMEIADALYGVAMKEQGVTGVVSQRLKEIAAML